MKAPKDIPQQPLKILDMLPELEPAALATVHANALRLSAHGTPKQKEQADGVLARIEVEQARRAELAPPPKPKAKPKAKIAPVTKKLKPAVE